MPALVLKFSAGVQTVGFVVGGQPSGRYGASDSHKTDADTEADRAGGCAPTPKNSRRAAGGQPYFDKVITSLADAARETTIKAEVRTEAHRAEGCAPTGNIWRVLWVAGIK